MMLCILIASRSEEAAESFLVETHAIFHLSGSAIVSPLFKNPLYWFCSQCLKSLLSLTNKTLLFIIIFSSIE